MKLFIFLIVCVYFLPSPWWFWVSNIIEHLSTFFPFHCPTLFHYMDILYFVWNIYWLIGILIISSFWLSQIKQLWTYIWVHMFVKWTNIFVKRLFCFSFPPIVCASSICPPSFPTFYVANLLIVAIVMGMH